MNNAQITTSRKEYKRKFMTFVCFVSLGLQLPSWYNFIILSYWKTFSSFKVPSSPLNEYLFYLSARVLHTILDVCLFMSEYIQDNTIAVAWEQFASCTTQYANEYNMNIPDTCTYAYYLGPRRNDYYVHWSNDSAILIEFI